MSPGEAVPAARGCSHSPCGTGRYEERYRDLYVVAVDAARRAGAPSHECEDIAQEAMLRAHRNWSTMSDHATPWVRRVATNLSIDHWRRQRAVPSDEIDAAAVDDIARADMRAELAAAFAELTPRQRDAFTMRVLEGHSVEHTASQMSIARAGVLKHTTRAYHRLRTTLR